MNVAAASALSAFFDVVALFVVVVRARDVERRALGERVQRREQERDAPAKHDVARLTLAQPPREVVAGAEHGELAPPPERLGAEPLARALDPGEYARARLHCARLEHLLGRDEHRARLGHPGLGERQRQIQAPIEARFDGWMMMFGSIIIIVRVVVVARGRAGSGLASALRLLLHHPLRQPTQRVLHQRAGVRPGRVARNALVVQDHVFQPERALERGERARGHGLASAYDGVQAGLHVRALALEQGGHGGGGRRTARLGRTPPRRDRQWRPRARRRKVSMRRARGNHVAVRRKRRERR